MKSWGCVKGISHITTNVQYTQYTIYFISQIIVMFNLIINCSQGDINIFYPNTIWVGYEIRMQNMIYDFLKCINRNIMMRNIFFSRDLGALYLNVFVCFWKLYATKAFPKMTPDCATNQQHYYLMFIFDKWKKIIKLFYEWN